jgi:hypothetical protein
MTYRINNIGNSQGYKRGKKYEAKQPQKVILRIFIEKCVQKVTDRLIERNKSQAGN